MPGDLIEFFKSQSNVMAAKFNAAGQFHHSGTKGREREKILRAFLADMLPPALGVGEGEIWSPDGQWSRQGDLIVFDYLNCPKLLAGSDSQAFPVESVAAVVEVKSRLDGKSIREATVNISSAKRLRKTGTTTSVKPGRITFAPATPILGAVFAFEIGSSLPTFRRNWQLHQSQLDPSQRVNIVCVLGEFMIVHIDRTFHLWDSASADNLNNFVFQPLKEHALMGFSLALLRALGEVSFTTPNMFAHVFSGRALEIRDGKPVVIPTTSPTGT